MASLGFNTSGQFTVNGNAVKYGQNYIINGGFDYWNYATSQTSNGYGSDDRWVNYNSGSTKVHSMVNATDTERALFNSSKFSRTVVTSVAGASNAVSKYQHIENVTKLAGKTVTVSFWAKADSNKNISIGLGQSFGTGGTPSAYVNYIGVQLVALTSTWQKKSITITLPSIVGKTLGTDGVHTSMTALTFYYDAGSNQNPILGQQSGTFDIAEVKLEEGSVATPWTPYEGEFGGEVQACQRYYEIGKAQLVGRATSTTAFTTNGHGYMTEKRVVPTMVYSGIGFIGGTIGTIVDNQNIVNMFSVTSTNSSAMTAGQAVYVAFYFTSSAEL